MAAKLPVPTHDPRKHVVVIGAGAVGSIAAIEALRADLRVTVVEPDIPGGLQATSYGNAGWLSSHSVVPPALPGAWRKVPLWLADPLGPLALRWRYLPRALPWLVRYLAAGWTEARVLRTAKALRTLLADAPMLHASLARCAGVPQLIEQRGLLHAYCSRAEFEADALGWRVREDVGVSWQEWQEDELRAREPDLDARYTLGIFVPEAGHCRNPGEYVAALARHASTHGASHVAARAVGFRLEGGRLRAVSTDLGDIECDRAVICAGAHSAGLAAAAGSPVPLESERGYHVVVKDAAVGPRTPVMVADGKLIVHWMDGGLRAAGQVEIAGLEAAPDWRRAEILHRHLKSMLPGLRQIDTETTVVHRWLGHRPSLPDGLPCIGPARASNDILLAFGHGHVGLCGSARTGRLVAQLLVGAKPEIDLAPFDPRRFS
ncbi:NAD(P)/FAD-dependent oxidoreductase [Xylophilus ampelinus]|uniref:Glycine/D-amino acid oxidase-like deaminating enzyme n=1 Tax=Xylophilus ampelinus TaxID=54067 RepID=A0A318SUU4_9BURK|nr:FAD-dependent oxidoreductase [Xylophilus ampelinus]MCS4511692.1 FAD-dependent oxidoreductase [Xylophilus ampelinus]PYE74209.1 glycine/D-amino acid oxidase-like deaminating enzyme [Xylophilus ampelinus]